MRGGSVGQDMEVLQEESGGCVVCTSELQVSCLRISCKTELSQGLGLDHGVQSLTKYTAASLPAFGLGLFRE